MNFDDRATMITECAGLLHAVQSKQIGRKGILNKLTIFDDLPLLMYLMDSSWVLQGTHMTFLRNVVADKMMMHHPKNVNALYTIMTVSKSRARKAAQKLFDICSDEKDCVMVYVHSPKNRAAVLEKLKSFNPSRELWQQLLTVNAKERDMIAGYLMSNRPSEDDLRAIVMVTCRKTPHAAHLLLRKYPTENNVQLIVALVPELRKPATRVLKRLIRTERASDPNSLLLIVKFDARARNWAWSRYHNGEKPPMTAAQAAKTLEVPEAV